jgi:hypothetical protein
VSVSNSINPSPPAEYRRYRKFLLWILLFFVFGLSFLLVASVAVNLYRRRHAQPRGETVSADVTDQELTSCWDELSDITDALRKHLENSHRLLGGYEPGEAQRWSDEGAVWRNQSAALGRRCRFPEVRGTRRRKELEEMAAAFEELRETERTYAQEVVRFGKDQVPRLDRIQKRVQKIGERLNQAASPPESRTP